MWIAIISTFVGIVGTFFGILIGLRSKQVYKPVLTFNIGLLYANQDAIPKPDRKKIKKATISTLIYGADICEGSEIMFACPYLLMNNSKLPISNITLQLEYTSRYAVENKGDRAIIEGTDYGVVFGIPHVEDYRREVQVIHTEAQIRYTLSVLRPGEKIVIADGMRFKTSSHNKKQSDNWGQIMGAAIIKELKKINKLRDFCVVDVFLYSESCPPVSRRIKLFWFGTNSDKELASLTGRAALAFWGGKWPKPGLYFNPCPWKKLFVEEYGELVTPKLERISISKDRFFYLENPVESERNTFISKMPPWNYYQSGEEVDNDVISKSGFVKLR